MSACCGTSTTVHVKYVRGFSKRINSSYEFDNETYVANSGMKLYCAQCTERSYILVEIKTQTMHMCLSQCVLNVTRSVLSRYTWMEEQVYKT